MRLTAYNLDGGGEGRADPIAEVLLAQRCDVVVLFEASHEPTLRRLERRLNLESIHLTDREDHFAILCRDRLAYAVAHTALNEPDESVVLEAMLTDALGKRFLILVAQTHSLSRSSRLRHLRRCGVPHAVFCADRAPIAPQPEDSIAGYRTLCSVGRLEGSRLQPPVEFPAERFVPGVYEWGMAPGGSAAVETDRLALFASQWLPVTVDWDGQ